jgi:hypothetical protein
VAKKNQSKEKKTKRSKAAAATNSAPKTQSQRNAAKQALAIWALLGEGGAAYGGMLKPEIGKAEREALSREGLVEVEKKMRGAYWLEVTDKGWNWAEQNLAVPLPEKAFGGAFVLRAWLARLQGFLKAKDFRLSDVLVAQSDKLPDKPDVPNHAELRQRIRSAYHDIAGGFDRRVLLRDLRPQLKDIDRAIVDAALMQMLHDQEISLMQLDYRPDVSGDDHAAALQIGNEPRHLIWIPK